MDQKWKMKKITFHFFRLNFHFPEIPFFLSCLSFFSQKTDFILENRFFSNKRWIVLKSEFFRGRFSILFLYFVISQPFPQYVRCDRSDFCICSTRAFCNPMKCKVLIITKGLIMDRIFSSLLFPRLTFEDRRLHCSIVALVMTKCLTEVLRP